MSKAIRIIAHTSSDAEFLQEVALPIEGLPHKGFPAGKVAIGFQPPSASELPNVLR
jgi:hypothetical protein